MNILSLFDGMSCGRYSLNGAGIPVNTYYASEIDKYAIKVAQANYPDSIQIGDVRVVRQMCQAGVFGHIDMLIGGSPCQNLSFAGKQKGLSTKEGVEITSLEQYKQLVSEGFEFEGQSYLFWEYVWIRELLQPTWWLLENVKMSKKWLQVFNDIMGVEGVLINSALVSAQNRQRYYWCNWPVSQPEDKGIYLRDIIESGVVDREKSYCIDANYYKGGSLKNYMEKARRQIVLSPEKLGNVNPSGHGMNGEGSKIAFRQSEARLMVRENVVTSMKQLPRGNNKGFEKEVDKCPSLTSNSWEHNNFVGYSERCKKQILKNSKTADEKAVAVCGNANMTGSGVNVLTDGITYRKLTPVECERLQGLKDGYTAHVSNSQRYKMLGNGWQCDTIIHIFECLKSYATVLGVKL